MPRGISLHIGLNEVDPQHYAGWVGELSACEADAEDMKALAEAQGFDGTLLLTADATKAAVRRAMRKAATALRAGDIFFLTYSGHGGQLPDKNGDEDDDTDETWCLFDGELVDDLLHDAFGKFRKGVRILVLSDSCHSGSVTREQLDAITEAQAKARRYDPTTGAVVGPRFRGMPLDVARKTYLQNRAAYDEELAEADPKAKEKVQATVRLISGCRDDQLSSDGTFNGLFTGKLKRVWADGAFQGNYAAFHEAIVKRMPAVQTPQHFVYGAPSPAFDAERPFQI